jgi:hydroxymethylpyrimidine pyrophosphatase-like HAD family hydrolase
MAMRHGSGDLRHIAELVAAEADSAALSHVGRSTVLDVTAQGVDKGAGTQRALRMLGIDATAAISFGDMPNDLAMFRVTGRSYAVGESDDEVMRTATEVLPGVEDDGFARKILELAAADWTIDDADPISAAG